MPDPVVTVDRRRARFGAVVALGAVAVLAGACGTAGLPSTPPDVESTSPSAVAGVPEPSAPAASGTPVEDLVEPPVAALVGLAEPAAAVPGSLGAVTWDDAGTDAPWLVPSTGGTVRPGATLSIEFDPAVSPLAWTARWAPVTASGAGEVASGVDGEGEVVAVVPPQRGPWSMQLEASFGPGRSATWYWRIDVRP